MDIRKLQKLAVDALEDVKAKDIEVINTTKLTSLFDRIIVASGDSTRQVKALARSVHDKVKEAGGGVIGLEGEDGGEWVLIDLGDIVVHVMQPAVRAYYNLEELWAGARPQPKGESKRTSSRHPSPSEGRAVPAPKGKRQNTPSQPPPPGGGGDCLAPSGARAKRVRSPAKAKVV
ncbi:Ribosomal silencing factor RsfS (modular protein) [Georgfuchsia toluolica]|uniref:Ribosomal silencing factor RsfS n=1 Tax=Georgfuchsia toluolica TaxID=424218 RepID=A0A916J572_9PROT|nr:ribosome silencing factor [Georgfuchsia toluolica]CAG4884176.1 Ribosomal silencing factor RsfS (modular protein) [Georgfuchsia toluolica]